MPTSRIIVLSSGTTSWNVPEGVYGISNVVGWGGGSAGRGGISLGRGGGGGGSGARSERTAWFPVLPGDEFVVEIGAGGPGLGYNVNNTSAQSGGLTRLTHVRTGTVLILANGGVFTNNGGGGVGGSTSGAVGDILTAGNTGGSSSVTTGSPGGTGATAPGTGGGAGGLGGDNAAGVLRVPTAGSPPGGGGGGGDGNSNATYGPGTNGGDGQIIITAQVYEIVGFVA